MTSDYPGGTYHGFSGQGGPDTGLRIERPPPRQFEPDEYRLPPRPKRGVSRGMLLGGVGVALGLGLLFGLFAKPELAPSGGDRGPMQPAARTAETPISAPVPVEVAAVTPPPVPKTGGKLEVLPPEMVRAAEARAPVRAPPSPRATEAPLVEPPPPTREVAISPPPPMTMADAAPPPRADPSFNCRYAASPAERMVCGDPELARLDRRLDRAFQRAVASGVPYRELRAEQDDWLEIREDAARRSPAAVESIYRQRIGELDDLSR